MKIRFNKSPGLTLVEIMVSVALLAFIVLGLVAMFGQTQRAFTMGMNNADYQDAGRAAMEMIAREVEQTTAMNGNLTFTILNYNLPLTNGLNFLADVDPNFTATAWPLPSDTNGPPISMFPVMQRLLFTTRYNRQWSVVGYRLDAAGAGRGIGTLYRFTTAAIGTPAEFGGGGSPLTNEFDIATVTNTAVFSRIADGVVDFRIQAYGTNGMLIPWNQANVFTNSGDNMVARRDPRTGYYQYYFSGAAVPAYVEVELGLLESRTYERYKALTNNPPAALAFLTNHAGQVHIFRQRVPVRALDSSVVFQ